MGFPVFFCCEGIQEGQKSLEDQIQELEEDLEFTDGDDGYMIQLQHIEEGHHGP
jgi:hypothetical protein